MRATSSLVSEVYEYLVKGGRGDLPQHLDAPVQVLTRRQACSCLYLTYLHTVILSVGLGIRPIFAKLALRLNLKF